MEEDVAKKDSNRERTADMLEEHNTSDNVIEEIQQLEHQTLS